MKIEEIKELIINELKNIAPEMNFNELQPDEILREELDIDSMDWLNFLVAIHEKTGVDIPESDYEGLDTLEHISDYVYNASLRS